MPRTYVRNRSGFSYSLENLYNVVSDFTNLIVTFREVLTFEALLKRFKEAKEAKANKETKDKRGRIY